MATQFAPSSPQSIINNYATTNFQSCWLSPQKYQEASTSLSSLENTWVYLLNSQEDVLLLCPVDNQQWVIWHPECGEKTVKLEQFCIIAPW